MMTQQLGFSILSAPLAAIDRRALSQAWYSALHLAQVPARTCESPERSGRAVPVASSKALAQRRTPARPTAPALPLRARREAVAPRAAEYCDRRATRSPLARRIERAFLRPSRSMGRATLTIEGSTDRVHVTIQNRREGLALVAVCTPRSRAAVSQALDEARYALALRGIALTLLVKQA